MEDEEGCGVRQLDEGVLLQNVQAGVEDALSFSLWDYGGQEVFYSLHHLFLSPKGVYLVVFSLAWLWSGTTTSKRRECLQYLHFWLNSIALHARDEDGRLAPVLLVGTHKDVVAAPAEHELINGLLEAEFGHHRVFQSAVRPDVGGERASGRGVLHFFAVDNRRGVADEAVRRTMATVQEAVEREAYVTRKLPYSWFAASDILQETRKTTPVISLDELFAVGRQAGMDAKKVKQECLLMLRYFDQLGPCSRPRRAHSSLCECPNRL
jgi:hypothetical protein